MTTRDVYVSVGTPSNEKQEAFVRAIEDRLRSEGLTPHTIGRNAYSPDAPLKQVIGLLDKCQGAVVIALERLFVPSGVVKRGGPNEEQVQDLRLPTPWNQIEAALAYSRQLPLMVMVEAGLKNEGLLDNRYDWYVQSVKPVPSSLNTSEFNGVFAAWRSKVEAFKAAAPAPSAATPAKPPADLTIGELISGLRPVQLWSIVASFVAVVAGAFALGAKLIGHA